MIEVQFPVIHRTQVVGVHLRKTQPEERPVGPRIFFVDPPLILLEGHVRRLAVDEFAGFFVKPFCAMIRIFANVFADGPVLAPGRATDLIFARAAESAFGRAKVFPADSVLDSVEHAVNVFAHFLRVRHFDVFRDNAVKAVFKKAGGFGERGFDEFLG